MFSSRGTISHLSFACSTSAAIASSRIMRSVVRFGYLLNSIHAPHHRCQFSWKTSEGAMRDPQQCHQLPMLWVDELYCMQMSALKATSRFLT